MDSFPVSVILYIVPLVSIQAVGEWTYHPSVGSSYLMSDKELSFADALCYCQTMGGSLVQIESFEELKFIDEMQIDKSVYMWTGGTDLKQEDNFVWLDGTPVLRSLFITGEPNNRYNDEHFINLVRPLWINKTNLALSDLVSSTWRWALCEKDINKENTRSFFWSIVSRNVIYLDYVIQTVHDINDLVSCILVCRKECLCWSVVYQLSQSTCYLYNTYSSRFNATSTVCTGCVHFE